MEQNEAQHKNSNKTKIHVPELARDILEQISFEARKSDYVDSKSGVSTRMSITAFENLISTAERRILINGEKNIRDLYKSFDLDPPEVEACLLYTSPSPRDS